MDKLVDGGLAGEQHDDAGEDSLPRPALQAPPVDGPFRVPECDQLTDRRNPERKLRT